ncbi:hypothetical protein AYO50_00360 [Acidobacteria bacterium SCGC AG-212-P17]|nr:hypothetical protein AYO50_00360 [Acidobacteria bacterium SCGC AG-212-P17]
MQADFSVELGPDAPALEIPWRSDDPRVRYYDLKNHPELVQQIPEVIAFPELGAFLTRMNATGFPLATAKCDTWLSNEVDPEEEVFGDRKFVSYVDLIFVDEADQRSFEKHEAFSRELCRLLSHAPEIAATVELVIRHCYYRQENTAQSQDTFSSQNKQPQLDNDCSLKNEPRWAPADSSSGFCITAYVTGFGDAEHEPVRLWMIGINLLQHAIVQLNRNSLA